MKKNSEPGVFVYRGDGLEAVHRITVAVVNRDGQLTHHLGDPDEQTMTRSSIKPFQLMPLLNSGAADKFNFSLEQLSIMSGSHNGTDRHREIVLSNLSDAGNNPDMLKCGCHWPLGMRTEGAYPLNGEDKDPTRHNCSGKHSGFLALAKFCGDDLDDYLNPENKSQTLIKNAIADYCEFPSDKMNRGIDGCSAPNYSLPLKNLALGFQKLAVGAGKDEAEQNSVKRIRQAMLEYPFMVSGEKRFDYDLKRSFLNNAVCKVGAEAVELFGFIEQGIGVAVKIEDGNWRALWPACIEVLKQIGIIDDIEEFPYLKKYERPDISNDRKIKTGFIEARFDLIKI